VAGLRSPQLVPLLGALKHNPSKSREREGVTPYNHLGVANRVAKNKKMKHTAAFGWQLIDNGSHNN
jgi:hypothetical protein